MKGINPKSSETPNVSMTRSTQMRRRAGLAADYLRRFTTFLADNSSAFTPDAVAYSLPNNAATTHALLMQKSTGPFELAVWGELATGSISQTVNLGATYPAVKVYDPVMDTVANFSGVSSVNLVLTDHPVIIEFGLNRGRKVHH
jgi:hypothetical protein